MPTPRANTCSLLTNKQLTAVVPAWARRGATRPGWRVARPAAGFGQLLVGALAVLVLGTVPPAGAAEPAGAGTAPVPLRALAEVHLGALPPSALRRTAFAQGPDDVVYFAFGRAVKAVKGDEPPSVTVRSPGRVLALAATAGDLYVQAGATVVDYSLPGVARRRSWQLPAVVGRPTSAGLLPGPGVLWEWSSPATDRSGFEYATVVEISTASSALRVVDRSAYPGDMAAGEDGLYFEATHETAKKAKSYLVHVSRGGSRSESSPTTDIFAPLALGPGYVAAFAVHQPSGAPFVDRFTRGRLAKLSSARLLVPVAGVIGTPEGLLAIQSSCANPPCLDATVVRVNPGTGAGTGGLGVPGAQVLLYGSHPSVVSEERGATYLVRLS